VEDLSNLAYAAVEAYRACSRLDDAAAEMATIDGCSYEFAEVMLAAIDAYEDLYGNREGSDD